MKKLCAILLILGLVSISIIGTRLNIQNNADKEEKTDNECIVTVNGEKILKQEIATVYNEFKETGVKFNDIVENSIDEILVIQQADDYEITCTDEEIEQALNEYRSLYPEEYEKAENLYGKDHVKKGQRNRILYSKVKEYFFDNLAEKVISNDLVKKFISKNNLNEQLKKYSYNDIKESLNDEIRKFELDEWILELREKAEIVYYK